MSKIIVTGAESTGKSTLAKEIAERIDGHYLPEYSREYLTALDRPYIEDDLLLIAKGQLSSEQEAILSGSQHLICDTSLLVMKVWSLYKYGRCHPWIERQVRGMHGDTFILPHYDIPYEYDPLRENPHDRDILYRMYYIELYRMGADFLIVRGGREERLASALDYVKMER